MSDLHSQPAIVEMTLEITRAATGKTETVYLKCIPIPEPIIEQTNEETPCQ